MSTMRVGLKQCSNSSTNSPSIRVLNVKKTNATHALAPIKEKELTKGSLAPALKLEGKENQETQAAIPVKTTFAQTDVVATKETPAITKDDLLCDEPTFSYWRNMAEKLEKEIDTELETSFNMSLELDKSYEELNESRNRLKVLVDVMDDIIGDVDDEEANRAKDDESISPDSKE